MRPSTEIESTRDRYRFRALSAGDPGNERIERILTWVLDRDVPDIELDRVVQEINDDAPVGNDLLIDDSAVVR